MMLDDLIGKITCVDCLDILKQLPDKCVDLVLTDPPYGGVNRETNGLRNLDKGCADIVEFDFAEWLNQIMRVCRGSFYVWCGHEQISDIFKAFNANKISTRLIIWEKTNPSPMNGDCIWLSGIEPCVYGKQVYWLLRCVYCIFFCVATKLNEVIDAVNELQERVNDHDQVFDDCARDITKVETMLKNITATNSKMENVAENGKCAKNAQDTFAKQRGWIGCVCRFWYDNPDDTVLDYLGKIQTGKNGIEYYGKETYDWFPHCEPVKPDDDIIYKGEK